jgi:predicted RNA-binding protein (virulence factor B family)
MIKVGQRNQLVVVDIFPMGYLLGPTNSTSPNNDESADQSNDNAHSNISEPPHETVSLKETTESFEIGHVLDVFVYTDADGSLLASTKSPKLLLNEFAALTVVGNSAHGCFFDWGIKPDLYAPEGQLHSDLDLGNTYVVRLVNDKLGKLVATTKIERFLESDGRALRKHQPVTILIYAQTPLGFKVMVDNQYQGLLYKSDLIKRVKVGESIGAFIKHIRDDGKLDVSLQVQNQQARQSLAEQIIEDLIAHDGMSTLTDKSSPDEIFSRFKVSKGAYKKAIGNLYRDKKIRIEKNCLYLNQ